MTNNQYQEYIHLSRYARWLDDKNRRETWDETVDRLYQYLLSHFPQFDRELQNVRDAVLNKEIMPSMRLLMTAGPAADRDNVAIFNCSYAAVNDPKVFDEILYILMCGTGVGFSCERQEIAQLPAVPKDVISTESVIVVDDSKYGWASAFRELISFLYAGRIPEIDYKKLRPAGARLKTFGGRSSGPEPLRSLFKFTIDTFKKAAGRKLTSVEVHDIVCKIGEVVVVGGVRRSALISLSNLSDDRMRVAKSGEWWATNPQRALANNSAVYTEKPDMSQFMAEWVSLYESKSGERGIFNRKAAQEKCESIGREFSNSNEGITFGTNPCGEIILRDGQFCNLTEVVARANDTYESLYRKVELATFLGTLQSTFTNFVYLRDHWKENCDEERLLGVSITGIMDCPLLNHVSPDVVERLQNLRALARDVNDEYAEKLGIPASAAITTVKPSGTVSSLVDSSSGIHVRHGKYYIRRVRNDVKDSLSDFMIAQGFPYEKDVMNEHNVVFEFPVRAPETSKTRQDLSAIDALELWLQYRTHWTDHNPSVTINVRESEWMAVGAWVYDHFDQIGGVSFLPYSDPNYAQLPLEEVDEATVVALEARMPKDVDWTQLVEKSDQTTASQELACVSGVCEI